MPGLRLFIASASEWAHVARTIQGILENSYKYEFDVRVWEASFSTGRTPVLDNLLRSISDRHFGVFVLGPTDVTTMVDEAASKGATLTPRDNVIFELGLFIGRYGRDRVYLVYPEVDLADETRQLRLPTDFGGQQLHGASVSWRCLREAERGPVDRRQEGLNSCLTRVVEDLVGRFETVTHEVFETSADAGAAPTPGTAAERTSPWARTFRRLSPEEIRASTPVLHPLLGIGSFVEVQRIHGRDFALISFADGVRRVPATDELFDPFERGKA